MVTIHKVDLNLYLIIKGSPQYRGEAQRKGLQKTKVLLHDIGEDWVFTFIS